MAGTSHAKARRSLARISVLCVALILVVLSLSQVGAHDVACAHEDCRVPETKDTKVKDASARTLAGQHVHDNNVDDHDHEHDDHDHGHDHDDHDHDHDHDHDGHYHDHNDHDHDHGDHGDHDDHEHDHDDHGHDHDHDSHDHHHDSHGHDHDHDHDDHDHEHVHAHGLEADTLVGGKAMFKKIIAELNKHSLQNKALGATIFVTLGGNAVILLFLFFKVSKAQLNVMVAFAVGGLLGDVFLHLIPHALEAQASSGSGSNEHGHSHGHSHGHLHEEESGEHVHDLTVGLAVLGGILSFFLIEKLLRVAGRSSGMHGHSHNDDPVARKKKDDDAPDVDEHEQHHITPLIFGLRPGAILNMAADTVHNFTDGMALAAAFQTGDAVGLTMTIAVLVHEVPHELGDFAVLLAQGFSKWGAFRAQFVSAIGALLGCYFGVAVSSSQPAVILSFTAGGFIYIALVSIVPDLLEEPATLTNTFLQCLAACAGIYMMIIIADLEAQTHAH